jgi:hypothetical protein
LPAGYAFDLVVIDEEAQVRWQWKWFRYRCSTTFPLIPSLLHPPPCITLDPPPQLGTDATDFLLCAFAPRPPPRPSWKPQAASPPRYRHSPRGITSPVPLPILHRLSRLRAGYPSFEAAAPCLQATTSNFLRSLNRPRRWHWGWAVLSLNDFWRMTVA